MTPPNQQTPEDCHRCGGSGHESGHYSIPCPRCKGSRIESIPAPSAPSEESTPEEERAYIDSLQPDYREPPTPGGAEVTDADGKLLNAIATLLPQFIPGDVAVKIEDAIAAHRHSSEQAVKARMMDIIFSNNVSRDMTIHSLRTDLAEKTVQCDDLEKANAAMVKGLKQWDSHALLPGGHVAVSMETINYLIGCWELHGMSKDTQIMQHLRALRANQTQGGQTDE